MVIAEIRHLEVSFGEKTVVRDASFSLEQGETFSLIGASGCGKSTLMRVLAGLQRDWRGEMSLFGSEIKAGTRYQGHCDATYKWSFRIRTLHCIPTIRCIVLSQNRYRFTVRKR
jgi:ABC-type Fe3+/spermidine/putrescine transport system ATPase subunit